MDGEVTMGEVELVAGVGNSPGGKVKLADPGLEDGLDGCLTAGGDGRPGAG